MTPRKPFVPLVIFAKEFYNRLAPALGVPVHITKGSSYLGNTPKMTWTDCYQKLKLYLYLRPYCPR